MCVHVCACVCVCARACHQVLLIEVTKPFKGTQTGNIIFWLTIMLGQPMIVLLYARDYQQVCYILFMASQVCLLASACLRAPEQEAPEQGRDARLHVELTPTMPTYRTVTACASA